MGSEAYEDLVPVPRAAVVLPLPLPTPGGFDPEYVVGGNEAGMLLGGETRAADAAVWRRDDLFEQVLSATERRR